MGEFKVKVLMVNKFFFIKGGSETYYFALKRKLEEEGHQVVDFSMKDEKNFESPYSEFFVNSVDYSKNSSLLSKFRMACNIIYSREAKIKFESLVLQEKPDIVHLHIFQHQISPSILDVCKKYNIPTVYTAHDLKMICLNYKMMHHDKICEDCKDGHLYHCMINRCVKNSFSKSCINTIEGYIHKWRKSYEAIDCIITPSNFYRKKFIEFGVNPEKIIYIPNFLDREKPIVNKRKDNEEYFLYFGRLSEEKGILTLAKAMRNVDSFLYIVGEGPLKVEIKKYIIDNNIKNIRMLGFKNGQELIDIVGNAKAVILPSEWYENGPYSAIEALQLGRPIIGADIGGIPELVDKNGFLFESGNVEKLKKCITVVAGMSSEERLSLQEHSIILFENTFTSKSHYKQIFKIYEHAIKSKTYKGFAI